MRIDFNVLWVDDQPRRVEAQIAAIRKDMEDEGFHFNPTQCLSMDDVKSRISDNLFNDEVDMILVDWDLGGDVKGQDVIAEIREKIQYKDVVFYSAQTAPDQLRQHAHNAGLEGVYCATRDGLRDEVVGVFESLVKKVLDIDHTRGIVMGATSDIDEMVNECLLAIHGALGNKDKEKIVADALAAIKERIDRLSADFAELEKSASFEALVEAHLLCTANDRLRILSRTLQLETLKVHQGYRVSVTSYISDVVPKRNKLGHRVLTPDGRPAIAAIGGGDPVSIEEMRALRGLILALRGNFRALRDALKGG
jgi:hypothetical protein